MKIEPEPIRMRIVGEGAATDIKIVTVAIVVDRAA